MPLQSREASPPQPESQIRIVPSSEAVAKVSPWWANCRPHIGPWWPLYICTYPRRMKMRWQRIDGHSKQDPGNPGGSTVSCKAAICLYRMRSPSHARSTYCNVESDTNRCPGFAHLEHSSTTSMPKNPSTDQLAGILLRASSLQLIGGCHLHEDRSGVAHNTGHFDTLKDSARTCLTFPVG